MKHLILTTRGTELRSDQPLTESHSFNPIDRPDRPESRRASSSECTHSKTAGNRYVRSKHFRRSPSRASVFHALPASRRSFSDMIIIITPGERRAGVKLEDQNRVSSLERLCSSSANAQQQTRGLHMSHIWGIRRSRQPLLKVTEEPTGRARRPYAAAYERAHARLHALKARRLVREKPGGGYRMLKMYLKFPPQMLSTNFTSAVTLHGAPASSARAAGECSPPSPIPLPSPILCSASRTT